MISDLVSYLCNNVASKPAEIVCVGGGILEGKEYGINGNVDATFMQKNN